MRNPNPEQKLAIEHHGGVLLSAGAGSGKTFVLENHIIYLTQKWIEEFRGSEDEFVSAIRLKFKQVVLMTFTKKAAGELELRLKQAFKTRVELFGGLWVIAEREMAALTCGTIHSFCLKLISQGFFPSIPSGQRIVSDSEFKTVITRIIERWFEENETHELADLFNKNKNNIITSLQSIMGDPSLRIAWLDANQSQFSDGQIDAVVEELLQLQGVDGYIEDFDLSSAQGFESKKWHPFLQEFLSVKSNCTLTLDGLIAAYEYFERLDFKIPVTPRGKTIPVEVINYYGKVKDFKDFLKKYGEHFSQFKTHRDTVVLPWFFHIKGLVEYVEEAYEKEDGLTFSDLEFYVLRGLRKPGTSELIADQYKYFIVDEFQDTSYIQFEVLKRLSLNDYNRLFCVGDLKQAIYGFRGGELAVFLDCKEKMPKRFNLKNNYRSSQAVINFNNIFFKNLFPLGFGFSGQEESEVPFEPQAIPESTELKGEILQLNIAPAINEEKLNNLEIELLEKEAIVARIKQLTPKDEVAILYRKLKPSRLLIFELIKNNIGFTAQVKVPYKEDPVVGLFFTMVEYSLNLSVETKNEYTQFLIEQFLSLLGSEGQCFYSEMLLEFEREKQYFGLYEAFESFLMQLGLSNATYRHNMTYIKELIDIHVYEEDIYVKLKKDSKESSSMEFKFGSNAEKVKIMTTHASKGLEFQHVILGGIFTNDSRIPDSSLVGKTAASFIWSTSIHGKVKFKTPQMLLEDQVWKVKEFAESKRLFYVANTRAVESLSWINIDFSERKRARSLPGSWSGGLNAALTSTVFKEENLELGEVLDEKILQREKNKTPMFHLNNLGVFTKVACEKPFLLPELSVTQLSQLAVCPRKFYYQGVCKISEDELKLLEQDSEVVNVEQMDEELSSHSFSSSAARGSDIHKLISQLILREEVSPDLSVSPRDEEKVRNIVDKLLQKEDNYHLYSEKQIKFEILSYMVSGIPDFYCLPKKDHVAEIWDFKTGKYSEHKLPPYWFQLMAYAQAFYNLKLVEMNKPIKIILYFVDEDREVERNISISDVENYFKLELSKAQTPWVKEPENCEYCPYTSICQE